MSQYLNKTGLETLVTKIKELIDNVQSNLSRAYNELLQRITQSNTSLTNTINNTKATIDAYTVNGHKISTNPVLTKADVGLSNVLNEEAVPKKDIGVTVAPLKSMKIPSQYLPSYVDDIKNFHGSINSALVESSGINSVSYVVWINDKKRFAGYKNGKFYNEWASSDDGTGSRASWGDTIDNNGVIPVSDKIYVQEDVNLIYRWSGTNLVEISKSLALGTTDSTAFPGDRGLSLESKYNTLSSAFNALDNEYHQYGVRVYQINQSRTDGIALVFGNRNGAKVGEITITPPTSTAKYGAMTYDNLTKLNGIAAGATADSAIPTSEIEALFA